jgi:integrase
MSDPHIEDLAYYQQIITLAQNSIQGVADNVQEKTLKQYADVVKRMLINDQEPITAATSKGTYYTYRASWIGYFANRIREELFDLENGKPHDSECWKKGVESIKTALEYFNKCKADPERKNIQLALEYEAALKAGMTPKFEYSNEWREKAKHEKINQVKRSIKERTRKLPEGWRNNFFDAAVNKGSKHLLSIAVMSCCGCRPKELENGIVMQWDAKKQAIHFELLSAKRKNENVEFRRFTVQDKDSQAYRYLQSQLFYQGKAIKLQGINYRAVTEAITRISKQYFHLKKHITPYCFRHAFAGDLHKAGLSAEPIAQALGHGSDRTQAYYSHSQKHSSGRFSIEEIESTEEVKHYREQRLDKLLAGFNHVNTLG